MDLQAYISSGILEAYVLGDISAEQAAEVERMAQSHPEVKAELEAIEIALESYAMKNAVNPSTDLFATIEEKLPAKQPLEEPDIKKPQTNLGQVARNFLLFALIVCLASLIFLFVRLQKVNEEKENLETQYNQLEEDCNQQQVEQSNKNNIYAQIANPATDYLLLEGTDGFPNSEAKLFVNEDLGTVIVNPTNLPQPAADQQYQLWAIVEGRGPVSLGLIDIGAVAGDLQSLAYEEGAQAYAITLEPLGGSVNPTLEMMHVSNI